MKYQIYNRKLNAWVKLKANSKTGRSQILSVKTSYPKRPFKGVIIRGRKD